MSIDSRLTPSISNVVFEIRNNFYLTPSGFKQLSWVCRAFRWLFAWTGKVDTTTQVCAQLTFDEIRKAFVKEEGNLGALAERSELIGSLYKGELNLTPLKSTAAKACASFESFLVQDLGFDRKSLTPPVLSSADGTDVDSSDGEPPPLPDLSLGLSVTLPRRPTQPGSGTIVSYNVSVMSERRPPSGGEEREVESAVSVRDRSSDERAAPPRRAEPGRPAARRDLPLPPASHASARGREVPLVGGAGVGGAIVLPEVRIFIMTYPMSDDGGDPTDGDRIKEIINTIHSTRVLKLGGKRKSLNALGDLLRWNPAERTGVHPLRFLSYILADDDLRGKFRDFQTQSRKAKWNPFVNGIAKDLRALQEPKKPKRREKPKEPENLVLVLPNFAASIGVRPGEIERYFKSTEKDRWQQMISFLVDRIQ